MRLQIILNASSIRFRYLDFSTNVGFVFIFIDNMYNPFIQKCINIFTFHAKNL
jgi:hypothetical protein